MQENRSFDHYFGAYAGVRGFDDHLASSLGSFGQPFAGNTTRQPVGLQLPFHLDTGTGLAACTRDIDHGWLVQHLSRGHGTNDAFVRSHASSQFDGPDRGLLTMGYYTRADLPYHYALADAFTICDSYHSSVIGSTVPNRLMALSGSIDPDGGKGGPVLEESTPQQDLFSVNWTTVPELLEDAGVSWKTYTPPGQGFLSSSPTPEFGHAILPYFSQYSSPTSPLHQKAFLPTFPDDFAHDVQSGTLPKVSWIVAPKGYDEHPPTPPSLGARFIDQVLQTLIANPDVWSKTVVFVTYDENGGFFDHVPPPVAPLGTSGEYLTKKPPKSSTGGVAGPIGLGFRVPALVVSPFSKGGYVSSELFDHTSQIKFLEQRFGIYATAISNWRRRTVGDLTSTLHLGSADARWPSLPSTTDYPTLAVTVQGCTPQDLDETSTSQPLYPQPAVQSMPSQEPGSPKRLPFSPRRLTVTLSQFAVDSAALTPTMRAKITSIARQIAANKDTKIVVTGYSDTSASAARSLTIGRARAVAVERVLKSQLKVLGITGVKLTVSTNGRAHPIASNATASGRAMNRRVVVTAT